MPGLVDTHFHPPEYHRAALSLEEGFGGWSVATLLPGELRFRNVTVAAEQSTAFVVSVLVGFCNTNRASQGLTRLGKEIHQHMY